MTETTPDPVAPLTPAAPGQRSTLELAARVMSIVMVGWLCAMAVFSWIAYRDGYVGVVLPVWNSLFVAGTLPIVSGVFARRLWGQRWVVGIATFTGISNALQASRSDSTLLWIGALLLGAVALTVRQAKPLFSDSDGNRGRIQQIVATVVTIGSVVISLIVVQGGGTERGREQFAAEVRQSYEKAGVTTVDVSVKGLDMVIEAKTDTDAQIDAAADMMRGELAKVGPRAKAWAVGFKQIVLTNGSYTRVLTPDAPR